MRWKYLNILACKASQQPETLKSTKSRKKPGFLFFREICWRYLSSVQIFLFTFKTNYYG